MNHKNFWQQGSKKVVVVAAEAVVGEVVEVEKAAERKVTGYFRIKK